MLENFWVIFTDNVEKIGFSGISYGNKKMCTITSGRGSWIMEWM